MASAGGDRGAAVRRRLHLPLGRTAADLLSGRHQPAPQDRARDRSKPALGREKSGPVDRRGDRQDAATGPQAGSRAVLFRPRSAQRLCRPDAGRGRRWFGCHAPDHCRARQLRWLVVGRGAAGQGMDRHHGQPSAGGQRAGAFAQPRIRRGARPHAWSLDHPAPRSARRTGLDPGREEPRRGAPDYRRPGLVDGRAPALQP